MSSVIFGVRLDELASVEQLRGVATGFLDGDRAFRIFTPNPEILLHAREDPGYADVLRSADLALPDGTGVAIVQTLRNGRSVRRWPGVEIAALLLRLAAERGETVAFVGGTPEVAERSAARWRALPGLKVVTAGAGVTIGEDGLASPTDREDEIVEAIRSAAPTIVLVGLGAPKQERWIERHADELPVGPHHDRRGRRVRHVGGFQAPRPSRVPNARARVVVAAGARTAAAAPDPARDRRVPGPRAVRSDRLSAGPVPDAAPARRAAERRDDQVGRGALVPGGPPRPRGRLLPRSRRGAVGARGRGDLDPAGAGTVGPSPRVELRRGRAAQHRAQPERGDGRARRPAPRDRRARRGLRGQLADGAVPPRGVPGHPSAPRAQRGARDVAPARRARDQPGPQAVGPAGGPKGSPVRGGPALAVRRRVRGLRTRSRHARRARHKWSSDRPAPQRRRPRTPRTPRAHPAARTRAPVPRHALVAAERRGALALPRRRPPRAARTRAATPAWWSPARARPSGSCGRST